MRESLEISKAPFQTQLAETEWWSGDKLLHHQFQQIAILLDHAYRTIPYYRGVLDDAGWKPGQPIDQQAWRRLQPLTRREVQRLGTELQSTNVPETHGEFLRTTTSGSTGTRVAILGTELDAYFQKAFDLRLHLWHRMNFSKKLARIRKLSGNPARRGGVVRHSRWGDEATYPFPTGPSVAFDVSKPIGSLIKCLEAERPSYLTVYPSILDAILKDYATGNKGSPGIELILTLGEVLEPEVRDACRRIWGVPIADNYSATEVGVIAIQCPDHDAYHVQAESALVEVVDDEGAPVQQGAIGRVLVTPLHNFAMPLLRYEIGDYAEVGEPCRCGRGLPVLRRILGRTRNMLVTPDGRRYWPAFGTRRFQEVAPIIQYQFAQISLTVIEVRLVVDRALTKEECARLIGLIQAKLPFPFEVVLRFCDTIPRGPNHKYEYFQSEVGG